MYTKIRGSLVSINMVVPYYIPNSNAWVFQLLFKKILYIYLFLERGEGRKRGRETLIGCFSYSSEPTTQAHALTGDRTGDLLLCGMIPNQQSHASQGGSICSLSLPAIFVLFGLFNCSHSSECTVVTHCGFYWHFSDVIVSNMAPKWS